MRRKILLSLSLVMVLVASALAWIVSTESGLRSSVSLAQKLVPELQVGQVTGRLLDDLSLQQVQYRPQAASGVQLDRIELNWQLASLLTGRLDIDRLMLKGITIHQLDSSEAQSAPEAAAISLPLQVKISALVIDDVKLLAKDAEPVQILNKLDATAGLAADRLSIDTLKLQRDVLALELAGTSVLTPPYQLAFQYQYTLTGVITSAIQAQGTLDGGLDKLVIKQQLVAPVASTQSLTIKNVLDQLSWQIEADAAQWQIAELFPEQQGSIRQLRLSAEGDVGKAKASVSAYLQLPDSPELTVAASLDSDDFDAWQFESTASFNEQQLRAAGVVDVGDSQLSSQTEVSWQNLQWPMQSDVVLISSPDGKLNLSGGTDKFNVELSGQIDWQQQRINIEAAGNGNRDQFVLQQWQALLFGGVVSGKGHLNWQQPQLEFAVQAKAQEMTVPESLVSDMTMKLDQADIEVKGTADALNVQTNADLLLNAVKVNVQAKAAGQPAIGFDSAVIDIALPEGSARYRGKLLWADKMLLAGRLDLDKVNPGIIARQWPGLLSGSSELMLSGAGDEIKVQDLAIQGQLRDRSVTARGDFVYTPSVLNVASFDIQSGQSRFSAAGDMQQDQLGFNWSLASPDLRDLYPDLNGRIEAGGRLSGTLDTPQIDARVDAANISYRDYAAQSLVSDISLTLAEGGKLSGSATATNLALPQLHVDELQMQLEGTQQAHRLRLQFNSELMNAALVADGSWRDDSWHGMLSKLDLTNVHAGHWHLSRQGQIVIGAEQQQLAEHCLASENGKLCLSGKNQSSGWQAAGEFSSLPVSLFELFVPELQQLQGSLRGQFDLQADQSRAVTGSGDIYLDDGQLQLEQAALSQQQPIRLNNTSLRYQLTDRNSEAEFHAEPVVEGVSAVNATVSTTDIRTVVDNPQQAKLQGALNTEIEDVSLLNLSHPAIADPKGAVAVNLVLAGTVAQPRVSGNATLHNGQVELTAAGISLQQLEAELHGDLQQLAFSYHARSGDGQLSGNGHIDLSKDGWQLQTDLQGEQFEVMNLPEAYVVASPELKLTMTADKTVVTGKLLIPEAELEPTQFNTTISPSKDVVIVGTAPTEADAGITTEVDVTVFLGDEVHLKALGFQGRLGGDLRITGNTQTLLLGNGEITVNDGSYQAYGQQLTVDDGHIRFAGGALDNPELDIKAVRTGKDYVAGLHIEGTAAAPLVNLFSEPEMSQDNILAYILLGRPLQQASASDAALLASAATGLGLQGGAMIGDQIASTFGLDEFSVRGDSADNAALYIGKYLSPKLYISYGVGVFEAVSTVELRYQLSRIWALKAESGTESGIDFLYTLEH